MRSKCKWGKLSSLLDLSLSLSLEGKENEMKNKTLEIPFVTAEFSYRRSNGRPKFFQARRTFERHVRTLGKKYGAFERVTEAFERQAKFSKNPIFLPSGRSNGAFERQAKNSGRSNV